jgi:hypothetical protein
MRSIILLILTILILGPTVVFAAGSCSADPSASGFEGPQCHAHMISAPVLADLSTDLIVPEILKLSLLIVALAFVASTLSPESVRSVTVEILTVLHAVFDFACRPFSCDLVMLSDANSAA